MKRGSLRLRLALWVGVLGLLQAIGVFLFAHNTVARELDVRSRAVLRDKVAHARHLLAELEDSAAVRGSAYRLVELVSGHAELHLAVMAPDSREPYVAFSQEALESLSKLRTATWGTDAFLEWQAQANGRPMLSFAAFAETRDSKPLDIIVTIDRTADAQLLQELLFTSATAAPLGLALVFVSAAFIVNWGLRPLRRFRETAAAISAKSLSSRLDVPELPTELQAVGAAFNSMLDRLDEGVSRLSEFSGDLAHELRTPLATLLGRTQVALSQPRSKEEMLQVLEGNVEELQTLSRLITDMLFLAQADSAKAALQLEPVDLAAEACKVAEYLELLGQERDLAILVQGAGVVAADRGLVQRAITNLLSNALRHSMRGTEVRVSVETGQDQVRLEVLNHGEPIAPEHLPRLFERFYRTDCSRSRDVGGSGLGLAIVKAIMTLHGGRVSASSTPGGETRFHLHFPVTSHSNLMV